LTAILTPLPALRGKAPRHRRTPTQAHGKAIGAGQIAAVLLAGRKGSALLAAEPRVGAASPGKHAVEGGRKRAVLGNQRPQHKGGGPVCARQAV
jgi:hypothetical protein